MSHKYATAALFAAGAFAAPAPQASGSGTANEPSEFTANPNVGAGGDTFTDSPRFRVYGATGESAETTLQMLESAYTCFVTDLGWRSSGLSYNSDSNTAETWYKENIYAVDSLDSAAGVMGSDPETGLSFVQVVNTYLTDPSVTVHEYGHALTYHAQNWVDQTATGAWWEPLANWFADTFMTSDLCASAREKYSQEAGNSVIELQKVIGDSYQVIVDGSVDSGNYYQSWPVLTYLTNNPDNYTGLGSDAVLQLNLKYEVGSNETPLHTLQRLLGDGASVAQVVGRYWAHMAYVDIGSEAANRAFLEQRETLSYENLEGSGESYTVVSGRQPQYFGANINPITVSGGSVSVTVQSDKAFTATLAVRDTDAGSVRYVDLENGSGEVTVGSSEEASLVVVNTPEELIQYDPFELSSEVKAGLDYTVQITGGSF
ncbi:hypothetical protein ASPVEDRAFT_40331 [Aspergillus versicolor CBS 583.65]|uniref:Dockerin type 1 n=1 Tax=Aspergillus versicolor CBS 583.65 TaxID=1036611 RepID=A0A1L9PH78_ASPVE|nr:uncharacterized protein ASPVEDRAFT_40331 [Aspergillus versicolor CBS 583.65]OJJ00823.1 hypothetical protein ASPVEDRAFT_40331 [Aspergillus versicolor CBS 583.65]